LWTYFNVDRLNGEPSRPVRQRLKQTDFGGWDELTTPTHAPAAQRWLVGYESSHTYKIPSTVSIKGRAKSKVVSGRMLNKAQLMKTCWNSNETDKTTKKNELLKTTKKGWSKKRTLKKDYSIPILTLVTIIRATVKIPYLA
jgi:hypothetical protein